MYYRDETRLESVAVCYNHPGHLQSCNMSLCTHISLHQCLDQNAFIGSVYSPAGAVSIQTISNSMSVAVRRKYIERYITLTELNCMYIGFELK